jgi:DNA-directed RNA polymerase specialized sigma24 family protein
LDFEKKFIEKLIKKDQNAFNEFYLKTIDVFSRYLNTNYFLDSDEIEDILADFYVKWRDVCDKYKFEQSFSAFVWTVFKNLLKDNFKKHKEIPFTSMSS